MYNQIKSFLLSVLLLICFSQVSAQTTINLAQGKIATQSKNQRSGAGPASYAVDGNTNGQWSGRSVTHTEYESSPWWEVDLGATYDISRIEIWNRTDCCSNRLSNYDILVKTSPTAPGKKFTSTVYHQAGEAPNKSFTGSQSGRYVRIRKNGRGFLSLAEVKVYGQSAAQNGQHFSRKGITEKEVITETEKVAEGDYICTTKEVDAAKSFSTNFIIESGELDQAIYPGALLYGEDVLNGLYETIKVARKPATVSTTASFIEGSPAIQLKNPNRLSSVREDINALMSQQVRGKIQATTSSTIEEMYNEKQLEFDFSGRFSRSGLSIYGAFRMSQNSKKKVIIGQFLQKYYTIDQDAPAKPADFFQHAADANRIIHGVKTPMYVSQVTYGRAAYFLLETEENAEEIEAELKAAYNGVQTEVEAEARTRLAKLLRKSSIKVLIIGGSTKSSPQSINGYEGFKKAVIDGGEFDRNTQASPISYTLKYLDNTLARINLTTKYKMRECLKNTNRFRVKFNRLVLTKMDSREPGNHNEVGGWLRVRALANGAETTFGRAGIISPEGAVVPRWGTTNIWGIEQKTIVHPVPGTYAFSDAKSRSETAFHEILSSAGGKIPLQVNPDGNAAGDHIKLDFETVYNIDPSKHSNVRFELRVATKEQDTRETVLTGQVVIPLKKANIREDYIELRDRDIYRIYYSIVPISDSTR